MTTTEPVTGVQPIWYRAKRVIRTAVQTLIAAVSAWGALALIAPQILTQLARFLPGSWILWLTGAVAFVTVVASALAAIMAIPQVNAILVRFGLGSVPASAVSNGGSV